MVAPLVAAAGISAVGSVLGGISGGKGAKKAAKIAQQTQQQQINYLNANRDYQYNLNAPAIALGNTADERIAGLLRLGGDPAASEAAFKAWRDSTGYQTVLNDGLTGVNNARFAGGSGISGATLRRLQQTGATIADGTFNNYLGQVGGLSAAGTNARGLVANVGNSAANQFIGATTNGAAGQIGAINAGTANTQNLLQNLANVGSFYMGQRGPGANYGSSYRSAASGYTTMPIGWADPYASFGPGIR